MMHQHVELPAAKSIEAELEASIRAAKGVHTVRAGCVLLAEDDDGMRELIAQYLRLDGYDVVEVRSGEDLIDHIEVLVERGGPDSIAMLISDVRMPGLTGLEVVGALRRALQAVPVLLITGFGSAKVHARAAELGALILDKPFDLDRLRQIVCTFVLPTDRG